MTRSDREILADAIGRELANARAAWRKEREIIIAETRSTIADMRAEFAELKLKVHEQASNVKDGAPGPQGERGERGEDGTDGKQGETGAQGDRGEPGAKGDTGPQGEPGSDGRPGVDGKDGAPGAAGTFPIPCRWADRIHYKGEIVTHAGSTWQAMKDTAREPPADDWSPIAVKGADAPVGRVCGLYDPQAAYRQFDVVCYGGSEWRAKHDDPGALPGDGWALSAKQGKGGPKGERGEQGPPGPPGTPGLDERRVLELIRREIERYHAQVA